MSPKQQLIAKGIFIASTLFSLALVAFVAWSVVTVSPLHPAGSAPSQGVSIGLALAIGLFVMAFNYVAYRGLTEPVKGFKVVFWCFIALHLFALPIGTAIALTLIYLWNQSRTSVIRPLGATL
ncbi:hypothetical protein [Aeromonas salmonicida]|uniref:hypothetical protein n=1 Tax=Aeromonas salmonicida TaxID=645 RepID=UPI001C5CE501|nr:hypothetical protein [Aeromonas salmonicida]ELI6431151.1 hypothetical protein [Aeromonas salmonicida subsp. salmonicida]